MGRSGGQAAAPAGLRAAGLRGVRGPSGRVAGLALPEACPERGAQSGLLDEAALMGRIEALRARVSSTLRAGRFRRPMAREQIGDQLRLRAIQVTCTALSRLPHRP
jgi:hypothetical protein